MLERVKYPLTPEAKGVARQLVAAWGEDKLPQLIPLFEVRNDGGSWRTGFKRKLEVEFNPPHLSIWLELAEYRLVRYLPEVSKGDDLERKFEILLLQELRYAVDHDFEVSDFFLTTSAVGTIVYGNLEVREGAVFQSGAAGIGDVHQSVKLLADELTRVLGDELLQNEPGLNAAIVELRSADQLSRLEKAGRVVQELGRCITLLGDAGAAIIALEIITRFLR